MHKFFIITISVLLYTGLTNAQTQTKMMLLHSQGQTMAVDIQNIDSIQFNQKTMALTSLTVPYRIQIDSVSFATNTDNYSLHIGWWGDIYQGESFFFHHINTDNVPLPSTALPSPMVLRNVWVRNGVM